MGEHAPNQPVHELSPEAADRVAGLMVDHQREFDRRAAQSDKDLLGALALAPGRGLEVERNDNPDGSVELSVGVPKPTAQTLVRRQALETVAALRDADLATARRVKGGARKVVEENSGAFREAAKYWANQDGVEIVDPKK